MRDIDEILAIDEEEEIRRINAGIRLEKEKSRIRGKSTCEYDMERDLPYLLFPDGHREYPTLERD